MPGSTDRHPCACCRAAVQAFCGSGHAGLGGNASLAVGPLGRQADAVMRMGTMGAALCYSYSCSRGAYAGGLKCTDMLCLQWTNCSLQQHRTERVCLG